MNTQRASVFLEIAHLFANLVVKFPVSGLVAAGDDLCTVRTPRGARVSGTAAPHLISAALRESSGRPRPELGLTPGGK